MDNCIFTVFLSYSQLYSYGGAPGAYGPSYDSGPDSFGEWATTVDLLPVPIDYSLGAIGDIIPDAWTTPGGDKIKVVSFSFRFSSLIHVS